MGLRRLGLTGLLVDCGEASARRRLFALVREAMADGGLPGVVEVVPAAVTVALFVASPTDLAPVEAAVRRIAEASCGLGDSSNQPDAGVDEAPVLVVPVVYEGEDLVPVAALLGMTPAELITWHTTQVWTCDWTGFMPGFGYLVGENPREVPRRATPRTRIPAGSVALASEWCGIYPGASPGGWQVIGRTSLTMFDPARRQPALLGAGSRVRFEVSPA